MEPNSAVMVFPLVRVNPDYNCKKGVVTSWDHTLKSFQKHFGKKFEVYGIHTDCENIYDESCDKTRTIVYSPTECFPDSTPAHIKFKFDTSQFNSSKEQKLYQVRSVSVIYQIILFVLDHYFTLPLCCCKLCHMSKYSMPKSPKVGYDLLFYLMEYFIPEVLFHRGKAQKVFVPGLDVFQDYVKNMRHMTIDPLGNPRLRKICRCGTACLVLPYDIKTLAAVLYYLSMLDQYFVITIAPSDKTMFSKPCGFDPKEKKKKGDPVTKRGLSTYFDKIDELVQKSGHGSERRSASIAKKNLSRYVRELKFAKTNLISEPKGHYSIYFHVIAMYAEGYSTPVEERLRGRMGLNFGGILVPIKYKGAT